MDDKPERPRREMPEAELMREVGGCALVQLNAHGVRARSDETGELSRKVSDAGSGLHIHVEVQVTQVAGDCRR
jgi:hypothetical protein